MIESSTSINEFVKARNANKYLFTPGPAALLEENILGLQPCFGRGDSNYESMENRVLDALKRMTGHSSLVRLQGSASLALEISVKNFLFGRVLLIDTGYYSQRLHYFVKSENSVGGSVTSLDSLNFRKIDELSSKFDWVVACYTETSCALKLSIQSLRKLADRCGASLLLDATASIGLEENHDLADVIAYSSCKGLFGLTGGSFIAFNDEPKNEVDSFNLSLVSHAKRLMTGPYHAIASLDKVLEKHSDFRAAVIENKNIFLGRFRDFLTWPSEAEPLLCTKVSCKIESQDHRAILYTPRGNYEGSVICHLGEVHLQQLARASILNVLQARV